MSSDGCTFCPLPWISSYVRSDSSIIPCCVSTQKVEDEAGKSLRFSDVPFEQLQNNPTQKQLRAELLAGKKPVGCEECFDTEATGGESLRQHSLKKFPEFSFESAKHVTLPSGELTEAFPIAHLDLQIGNYCNLRCRTCSIGNSTGWYGDHYELYGSSEFEHADSKMRVQSRNGILELDADPFEWAKGDLPWAKAFELAQMANFCGETFHLNLQGGEPLLHKGHIPFLKKLHQAGISQNMKLSYVTNLTSLPSEVLELWKHFKDVAVGVSLDGVGKVNDYLRYPSRFSSIEKNLQKLATESEVRFWVQPSIGAYNVYYLPEIFEWSFAKTEEWKKPVTIGCHYVFFPRHMSPSVLPERLKEQIIERLESYEAKMQMLLRQASTWWISFNAERYIAQIQSTIKLLNLPANPELLELLLDETAKVDAVRKQSAEEALPEVFSHLRFTPNEKEELLAPPVSAN